MPIRIVVAVGVRLYRDGLASVLSTQDHLRIEATAATRIEAESNVRLLQPDVAIVDISFEDGLAVVRELRSAGAQTRIIAFAVREEISAILKCAEAGADAFVTANSSIAELIAVIERTAAGELLCSPVIAAQLLRRAAQQKHAGDQALGRALTNREQQVFSLLKRGHSNKEIAASLNIAEPTVKNHVHHVLEKLQVSTRGQAVAGVHR